MPRTSRSSLINHRFPAFYACYLLKSIRTPRATATYIGSTPSPPRRIRQHNGEISQGAWKTKHNRPWIMQMIVHGFPSKLAALQFEWAWQHPHMSRHLRDDDGRAVFNHRGGKFRYMNTNVRVARSMVSSHPFNTWPLGVKLFTEDAEKAWGNAAKFAGMPPLPPGLSVVSEFEGVDGKSGKVGTGRTGPIDVTDDLFTSGHLRKASSVFSPESALRCSICHEPVQHDADPLTTALCPTSHCMAVSHLSCLSHHFLQREPPSSTADIIPRGGTCGSCHSYILWGDVIRGCYRRHEGGAAPEPDLEDADDQEEAEGHLFGGGGEDDAGPGPQPSPSTKGAGQPRMRKRAKARVIPGSRKTAQFSTFAPRGADDEREHFDLDNVGGNSSDEQSSDGRHPLAGSRSLSKSASSKMPPAATGATSRRRSVGSQGPSHDAASTSAGTVAAMRSDEHSRSREGSTRSVPQMSRKPYSADTDRIHAVDHPLPGAANGDAGRISCPPPDIQGSWPHKTRDTGSDLTERASQSVRPKPPLRPFPHLPPLSQPHRPRGDRGCRTEVLDNEVVEISD